MKTYYSKIDSWFWIIIVLNCFSLGAAILVSPIIIRIILFILLIASLSLLNTKYLLNKDELIIICGLLPHEKIDIHKIIMISETKDYKAAKALSLDRIRICDTSNNSFVISPKHKVQFAKELKKINTSIRVVCREA